MTTEINEKKERQSAIKTWSKLVPFLKAYKKNLAAIAVFMVVNAVIDISYPIMAGYAVNKFVVPRTTEGLLPFAALYLLLVATQAISTTLFTRNGITTEVNLNKDLRHALFTHLQTLSFSYYNTTPVGTIVSRVMSDTERISSVFAWSMVDLFWALGYIIGCIIVMLVVNWKLALMIICVAPFIALITFYFQKKILAANREVRNVNAEITRHYNEGITGAKTTKTLVIEDKNSSSFHGVTEQMETASIRSTKLGAMYVPMIVFLTSLAVAFVITSGGNMVMVGTLSIGTLTTFVNYAFVIGDPMQSIAHIFSELLAAQVNIERFSYLNELEAEIKDSDEVIEKYGDSFNPKRENWEPIEGNISFDDIDFKYPDGSEYVLKNFSLDVPAGTTVAIVGETGAGKSTLVNLACRFFEPTRGKILIDGKDYRDRSMLWLHSNIGYVLQTPHLFSGSVKENLLYGKLDATDEEIESAAKMVGAHEFIMKMEKGYDTDVGEGGNKLSTGEKQLLSFARAILANPRIFVLDEATSSIDTKTEELIQTAISKILENRTSFLIAHRLSTIRKADIILVVKSGRIIERGTHSELMQQKGYYSNLYNKQFESETTESVFTA